MKTLPSQLLQDLTAAGFVRVSNERAPVIFAFTCRADSLPSIHQDLVLKQGILDAHDPVTLEVDSSQQIRAIVYGGEDEEDAVDGIVYCEDFEPLTSDKGMALLADALGQTCH